MELIGGNTAIGFRFFEILLNTRDPNRIIGEHARIKSMDGLLQAVGIAQHIVEDFAEVTFSLLNDIASPQYTSQMLLKSFNQDDISSYIICHLKVTCPVKARNTSCADVNTTDADQCLDENQRCPLPAIS